MAQGCTASLTRDKGAIYEMTTHTFENRIDKDSVPRSLYEYEGDTYSSDNSSFRARRSHRAPILSSPAPQY